MSKETIDHVLVHSSGETETTVECYVASGLHVVSAKARPSGIEHARQALQSEGHCWRHFPFIFYVSKEMYFK